MRQFLNGITGVFIRLGTQTGPLITSGAGSPEGVLVAPVGSQYSRTDGGTNTTIYRKESGAGNTGWIAVSNAGGGSGLNYQAVNRLQSIAGA